MKQNTWFLVLIGGIGHGTKHLRRRREEDFRRPHMKLTPYAQRPSIVGIGFDWPSDDENSDEEPGDEDQQWR